MSDTKKQDLFASVENDLIRQGFEIDSQDRTRPWGGFFVIDENQAQQFSNTFFDGISVQELKISGKLSPKILVVEPSKRLSWQYHHRRAEIWQVVQGTVGVITSDSDEEGKMHTLRVGDEIKLECGARHRLVGLEDWGVVAEIWQHTDPENPSDEEDIVRIQDDFGR